MSQDPFRSLLHMQAGSLRLGKAGPASLVRFATMAAKEGRRVVLLAHDRESFSILHSLLLLFLPDLSQDELKPSLASWEKGFAAFRPGFLLRREPSSWASRLAGLYTLFRGTKISLMTPETFLLKQVATNFFEHSSLDLSIGMECLQEELWKQACNWGYRVASLVSRPGEIAKRGAILDIFASGYDRPLRFEFAEEKIIDIRSFELDTQRSLGSVNEVTLIPASHIFPSSVLDVSVSLEDLRAQGRIDENTCYLCNKLIREGKHTELLPGMSYENASVLDAWLSADTLFFCSTDELSMEEQFRASRNSLAEQINGLGQAAELALRDMQAAMPWHKHVCLFAEQLSMGVSAPEIIYPEEKFESFQDIFPEPEAQDRPWLRVVSALKHWSQKKYQVLLSFGTRRSRNKFLEMAEQEGIRPLLRYSPSEQGIYALISPFKIGVALEEIGCIALGEKILFPKAVRQRARSAFVGVSDMSDLQEGDLLIHRDYGVGRFCGLSRLSNLGVENDFLLIAYKDGDKLYLPIDKMSLLQKLNGEESASFPLDKLGGSSWKRGKEQARKAIESIAADLVDMYALRKVAKGFQYPPRGELYREFEASFGFEETADQGRAIEDVLSDMEKAEPMDRLICGDVGFGKTEVALRAAFRAASEGRQVALLCPTTVLAEQHYQTFVSRMSGFGVNVAVLSRIVPADKQREVLASAEKGLVDVLIGTHRLLSPDVVLPKLGLLILDEEQRFGVRHKERLKAMRQNVDVLTLTATPIPRTLQLSMSGIRDLSVIETPPPERKAVESHLVERSPEILREAVQRELDREGQVFWVANRVSGLSQTADMVQKLCPMARVAAAHGRMTPDALDKVMSAFWHGEVDVLVCTTIIESGLDFPRANTIIVDQAQNFGLGQLYQLRGRVGRSDRQAYAYFVVPSLELMREQASQRLTTLLESNFLGAGFKIAMEDLRIRGAGNILGEAQSGHIARVGIDMYLEMLEEAVERLTGKVTKKELETELSTALAANIPASYIEDNHARLFFYRELTSAKSGQEREQVSLCLRDRFGPLPTEVQNLLAVLDFKQFLGSMDIQAADVRSSSVKLVWREDQKVVDPLQVMRMVQATEGAKIVPPASIILPLPDPNDISKSLREIRCLLDWVRVSDTPHVFTPLPKPEVKKPEAKPAAPEPKASAARRPWKPQKMKPENRNRFSQRKVSW